jgi:TrmH family RNA methyltransferase
MAGNLGAVLRVAANFGVPRIELVRPVVEPDHPDVVRWACGAHDLVELRSWRSFHDSVAGYRTVVASASGRGRPNQPFLGPAEACCQLTRRGVADAALVFGNETSGLRRDHLDRCDLVVRVPTVPKFPVLNLAQAVAIILSHAQAAASPSKSGSPTPAAQQRVDELMDHLEKSLLAIGFLDPESPQRILRKVRRLLGRAGVTDNEVDILRGVCRQMAWAARTGPLRDVGRFSQGSTGGSTDLDSETPVMSD